MNIIKVKKLFAVMLAILLSMTALAGCSATDTEYIKLSMEASKLDSYAVEGDVSFETNPDGMYAYYYSDNDTDPIKVKMNFSGNLSIKDELYFDADVKYGIDDPKMPHDLSVVYADNMLYMPAKDFVDISALNYKYSESHSDKLCAAYKTMLEKEFAENDYVIGEIETGSVIETATYGIENAELTNLLTESFKKMFLNLSSGMTQTAANGVILEITPEKGAAFLDDLIKYVKSNKKMIYKETLALLKTLEQKSDDMKIKSALGYAISEFESDEQGFYDEIDEMVSYYENMNEYDKEATLLALKGSYLKSTISKNGDSYTNVIDANFKYRGIKLFSVKGQVKITKKSITPKSIDTQNTIDSEDASTLLAKVDKKVNPATSMTISWQSNSDWTSVQIDRVEGYTWDRLDRVIENGSMYLPMRKVCEWFGEEIVWDNAAKKAYVTRADNQIEMTGRLDTKTTYVKIRDFEKLGYTVDYEYDQYYKEHIVTIQKN